MPTPRQNGGEAVYQMKVSLKSIKPALWRRFLVPGDITLHRLHLILQAVMGWQNYHLYRFSIGGVDFGEPDPEGLLEMRNAYNTRLSRVAGSQGTKFLYEYDFGDGWEHGIEVEKVMVPEEGASYPVCLDGGRACPPEDCGGVWGYRDVIFQVIHPGVFQLFHPPPGCYCSTLYMGLTSSATG